MYVRFFEQYVACVHIKSGPRFLEFCVQDSFYYSTIPVSLSYHFMWWLMEYQTGGERSMFLCCNCYSFLSHNTFIPSHNNVDVNNLFSRPSSRAILHTKCFTSIFYPSHIPDLFIPTLQMQKQKYQEVKFNQRTAMCIKRVSHLP